MPTKRVSRLAACDPLGELGGELERLHVGALDVLAVLLELRLRPALDHAGEVVVRRDRRPAAAVLRADVGVEAVRRQPAPVRVVGRARAAAPRCIARARTAFATSECLPSAPTTTRARSVTVAPPLAWPRMPVTRPSSTRISSTVKPSRSSAPAATAASTSRASSTIRRGQYARSAPSAGRGVPEIVTGPKSNEYLVMGGQFVASSCSRIPHLASAATAGWMGEVRGHRVAGERGLVDQQHPVAVARQQHRCGRAATSRPDDDHVVVRAHVRVPLSVGPRPSHRVAGRVKQLERRRPGYRSRHG